MANQEQSQGKVSLESIQKMQIAASYAHNPERSNNMLFMINNLLARRSVIAQYYLQGKLKEDEVGLLEFNHINELIKQHLGL